MKLLSSYFSRPLAGGIVLVLVLYMLLLTSRGVLLGKKNGHWGGKKTPVIFELKQTDI